MNVCALTRARCRACSYAWIAIVEKIDEPVASLTLECPSCKAMRGTITAYIRGFATITDAQIAGMKLSNEKPNPTPVVLSHGSGGTPRR